MQRPYTDTAGRIENSQVSVYLVYAGRRGHAAVDRELCVPHSWASERDLPGRRARRAEHLRHQAGTGGPHDRPVPGRGPPAPWVAGDEVHGGNPRLRAALEERSCGYVLAVARTHEVPTPAGKLRAGALSRKLPRRARQKQSAGAGAKGHRLYDWAAIDLARPGPGSHQMLIRRNGSSGELTSYRCYSPRPVPLIALVRVAGSWWRVEEFVQSGKGLAGLDEHQVPRFGSWTRWVTLTMLAHAFLAVVRADEHEGPRVKGPVTALMNPVFWPDWQLSGPTPGNSDASYTCVSG